MSLNPGLPPSNHPYRKCGRLLGADAEIPFDRRLNDGNFGQHGAALEDTDRARRQSLAVLLVADFFHPVDILAVERFSDGDMSHRSDRSGAVPVLLAGWKPDDVAGPNLFDRSTLALHPVRT